MCDCALRWVVTPSRVSPSMFPVSPGIDYRFPTTLCKISGAENGWIPTNDPQAQWKQLNFSFHPALFLFSVHAALAHMTISPYIRKNTSAGVQTDLFTLYFNPSHFVTLPFPQPQVLPSRCSKAVYVLPVYNTTWCIYMLDENNKMLLYEQSRTSVLFLN